MGRSGALSAVLLLVLCFISIAPHGATASYKIGVGIADVTGPSAEVGFMGYAELDQKGKGIHTRQFSRAFIMDDGENRMVFVSIDCAMMGTSVRREVLARLRSMYGNFFNEQNLMLSASHTHSTPGGYMHDLLFDVTVLGFVRQSFVALVAGIVISIRRAYETMTRGRIYLSQGDLLDASINRSPTAYLANPESERAKYEHNTDKTMVQLKFVRDDGKPMGAVHWYAVHPTSMNNTNTLVSSDNTGRACVLFEQRMNPGKLIGKGPFVAAFAATNLGDVSPNIKGPRCEFTGRHCDAETSSCSMKGERCMASGPGVDMFDSTRIIAEKLFGKAWDLWNDKGAREVKGTIKIIHQYVDMPTQKAEYLNPVSKKTETVTGCLPAMGYSFGAGTTDGPGAFTFTQGMKTGNPLWNTVRNFLAAPSRWDIECHHPKPILLATGEMDFPFEWQPRIVSTQLGFLGDVAIACVPGEFTTMSGRRMRDAVSGAVSAAGGPTNMQVIIAGLCNTYSDYVVTPEEYQVQRYEGASTIYGPHTLTLYLNQYSKLAAALLGKISLDNGPEPPDLSNDLISFVTPVVFDTPKWNHKFGDCILEPQETARAGETVMAKFVSGHPRNNLTLGYSYLTVERLDEGGQWTVEATDANWETKFHWIRVSPILGSSEALIEWEVPQEAVSGTYRICHCGSFKYIFGGVFPYQGCTRDFKVINSASKYTRFRPGDKY